MNRETTIGRPEKESKLVPRQVALFFIAFSAAVKFINLPAVTARYAREGLWISAAIDFLFDGILIAAILFTAKTGEDDTFFECAEKAFGKPVAIALCVCYCLFFLVKSYIPVIEQKYYVEVTLYETAPTVLTFLPFFAVCAYISYKGLRGIGRCADVCTPITLAAFFILIALSLATFDATELLPLTGVPAGDIFEGSFRTAPWHLDSSYLLFLAGNVRREKTGEKKILIGFGVSALLVLVYMCVLYGEFGAIAERQYFSPVRMGKFNVSLTNIGRVDYFSAFAFALSCIFALSTPVLFASVCLDRIFRFKRKFIPSLVTSFCLLVAVIATDKSVYNTMSVIQYHLAPWMIGLTASGPVLFFVAKTVIRIREEKGKPSSTLGRISS